MGTLRRDLLLLAIMSAICFALHLGAADIMPPDEPRYAAVSREMFQSGNYLEPTLNGEVYKEKPPMLFWLSAGLAHVLGDVDPWAARLPSAAAATATVLVTFALAQGMLGQRVAWLAALILLSTARFWWEARVGQIDMLLTAFVTGAIYALWQWHQQRQTRYLVLLYAMLSAGMLCKGPPALVFPLLLIVAFYWGQRDERRALRLGWGLAAVVAIFLLWLVPARMLAVGMETITGSEADTRTEFLKQTVGRFLLGVSKAEWPWFYVQNLVKDLLPWTLLLPLALPAAWRARRDNPAMRFLWAWVLPAFIFFTISVAKRETYILPLYPAFAILIAVGLEASLPTLSAAWRRRMLLFWGSALFAVALAPWFVIDQPIQTLGFAAAVLWCAVVLACGLDGLRRAASGKHGDLAVMMAAHTVAILCIGAICLLPAMNPKYSVKEFCTPIADATDRGDDFDVYSLALFREELLYHSRHPQKVVLMEALDLGRETSLHDLRAQAELRSRLRKWMSKIPLDETAASVVADQAKLEEALGEFIAQSPERGESEHLLAALRAELDRFQAAFAGPRAAVGFVEERDWRWLCAVEPDLRGWPILRERTLPGNTLLLFANTTGAHLLP